MDRAAVGRWLLPADTERNPEFQEELFRLSHTGLRLLGAMEMALALFLLPLSGRGFSLQFWAVLGIGTATIALAQLRAAARHARAAAVCSGWLAAAALIEIALFATPGTVVDDHLLYGDLSVVVFSVATAVQLIPLQACVFGSAIGFLYGITAPMAGAWDGSLQVFTIFLTCFATAVSGLLYARRREAFEEHQRMIEFREILSAAQSRAQAAETAIAVGRLAAALTHEINTPLGALKSAVDTMNVLAGRQSNAAPEDRERLLRAQADLRRSMIDSADRLATVVARLKRLITLDRAEKQAANINDLISDAGLVAGADESGRIETILHLNPAPPVMCSTDQMTTAIANLLTNAASAIEGEGAIEISTTSNGNSVEISIRDTGRGMAPEEAATAFEPGFKVKQGRVLGGNWSLFTTRQIVQEHGGDIWIESQPGKGTTVHVRLPAVQVDERAV